MTNFKFFTLMLVKILVFFAHIALVVCSTLYVLIGAPVLAERALITVFETTKADYFLYCSVMALQVLIVILIVTKFLTTVLRDFITETEELSKLCRKHYKKLLKKDEIVWEYHKYCVENKVDFGHYSLKDFLETLPNKLEIEK